MARPKIRQSPYHNSLPAYENKFAGKALIKDSGISTLTITPTTFLVQTPALAAPAPAPTIRFRNKLCQ